MNESNIENALKAVIENASAAIPSSISWPNLDHDGQPQTILFRSAIDIPEPQQ